MPSCSAWCAAPGTYEACTEDYKVPPTGMVGGTAYALCGNNWWSYDTSATIVSKLAAMKASGNVSGDTTSGTLISAVYNSK